MAFLARGGIEKHHMAAIRGDGDTSTIRREDRGRDRGGAAAGRFTIARLRNLETVLFRNKIV
jgi:hypothetical protein